MAARKLSTPEAALRQAMALHRAGREREADALYAQVLRAEPLQPQALRLRGVLARDSGDLAASLRLLRKAVAAADSDPEPCAELGLSYLAAGYLQLAEAAFREAVERNPESRKALANLGALLQHRGHVLAAIAVYRQVIALDPDDLEVRCNLAHSLVEAGRGDDALQECDEALIRSPDHPAVLATRGAILCSLERYAEAVPVLEAALESPTAAGLDEMALINLALAFREMQTADQALLALQAAVQVNPDNARAAADLALLLSAEGRYSDALATSDEFLQHYPGERLVLAARAVVLRDAGREDEARALLDLQELVAIRELGAPDNLSIDSFNAELTALLLADPSLLESPISKSTRGGAQTGEFNTDQEPLLARLQEQLNIELRTVIARWRERGLQDHPAMAWASGHWTLRIWGTVLEPGGCQLPHIHPLAWLSGVYYVQIPDGITTGEAGALEFGELPTRFGNQRQPDRRQIAAIEGRVVIFPSYFHHRTLPFTGAGQRISIAFDVVPVRVPAVTGRESPVHQSV
ncbi:MAG: tetratricopeptide repeat protein [Gammaproteobacteria bacterium]